MAFERKHPYSKLGEIMNKIKDWYSKRPPDPPGKKESPNGWEPIGDEGLKRIEDDTTVAEINGFFIYFPKESPSIAKQETRRKWANCFPGKKNTKKKDWEPDFIGATTVDNGGPYWILVYKRLDEDGDEFLSVQLKEKEAS
jgi:hypothetical protein